MLEKRYPKEVLLKDGSEIILKTPDFHDRDVLHQFYCGLSPKDRWFFKEDPTQEAVIDAWLTSHFEKKAFSVLAFHKDRVVAHASLLLRPEGGRKHVGRLRIMVAEDFRNKRLGSWMIFDLIRRAMELGLKQLRADFVVGVEDTAIEAVTKLDFFKAGLLRRYVMDPEGRCHDYQIMIKHLHSEWGDF